MATDHLAINFDEVRFSPGVTAVVSSNTDADQMVGRPSVIDGDTLEIHGKHIRILDIDAPEAQQLCTKFGGEQWHCGQEASLALADFIGAQIVTCDSDMLDNYGRYLARCTVRKTDVAE